jgi:hypothetical protein
MQIKLRSAISAVLCELCVKSYSARANAEITESHRDRGEEVNRIKGVLSNFSANRLSVFVSLWFNPPGCGCKIVRFDELF